MVIWNAKDLGIDQAQKKKVKLHKLFQPVRDTKCEMVTGNTPEESAENLALKLRQAKVF